MDASPSSSQHVHKSALRGSSSQSHRNRDGHARLSNRLFGRGSAFTVGGGSAFPHHRLVIITLGLLDAVLLVVAVALGVYCGEASGGNLQAARHSPDTPLIIQLNYLRSNHSNVVKAKQEALAALETELSANQRLTLQMEQQRALNDDLQGQIQRVKLEEREKRSRQSEMELSCDRCLAGWVLLNSSCYYVAEMEAESKKNWPESREDCIHRGADLLVIDDLQEQKLVNELLLRPPASGVWWSHGFWMGITDVENEGVWIWINNVTQVEPFYWVDREPNNAGLGGENCGALHAKRDFQKTWFDGQCHRHKFSWVCEMEPKQP